MATRRLKTYTAFCIEADRTGTIWISSFGARDAEHAISEAREQCAADWGMVPDDVHVLGIAKGEVDILHWED